MRGNRQSAARIVHAGRGVCTLECSGVAVGDMPSGITNTKTLGSVIRSINEVQDSALGACSEKAPFAELLPQQLLTLQVAEGALERQTTAREAATTRGALHYDGEIKSRDMR